MNPSPLSSISRVPAIAALYALALLVSQSAISAPAAKPTPTPAPEKGYNAYHLIRTRNIFDPDRRPVRTETAASTRPASSSSSSRGTYISLTGTMVTEGKSFAFFTGSRSEYNSVVQTAGQIAGFKIKEITSTHVDLERVGKPFVLVVGKQMTLDGTNVTMSATPAPDEAAPSADSTASSAPAAPAGSSSSSSAPSSGPADKSEILRRMMERRQKEVSQ
jgi:hypothetical protein